MTQINLASLVPASEEARKHGCTCTVKEGQKNYFYIKENCPLHWHINLVKKTGDIYEYVQATSKTNKNLYWAIIIVGLIMSFVLYVK